MILNVSGVIRLMPNDILNIFMIGLGSIFIGIYLHSFDATIGIFLIVLALENKE